MDLGLDEVWPAQQDTWPCDRDLHEDDEGDGEGDNEGDDEGEDDGDDEGDDGDDDGLRIGWGVTCSTKHLVMMLKTFDSHL